MSKNRNGGNEPLKQLKPKNKTVIYFKKYGALYLMMLVPIIYFLIFKYGPMIGNVLAFRRYSPGGNQFGENWVGFRYFQYFLSDSAFWRAFRNTVVLSLLSIVVNFPIPIIFAIGLNEIKHKSYQKTVQTVSYLPRFISTVVVIAIVNELLSPSSGIINLWLQDTFNIEPILFMQQPQYFRPIYILTDTWQFTGWTAIIYLAAISAIPVELYEAADIDGASRLQKIRFVTIPSILPTVMTMLILEIGRVLSVGFEKVLLMYSPANSSVSDVLQTLVYRTGLAQGRNYSLATAIGLFTSVVSLILITTANYTSKKLTNQGIY